jgi:hypothetical protein
MKVTQLINDNGNAAANQFVVYDGTNTTYFQSYNTIIARSDMGKITLDSNALDYSRTTSKHLYIFLRQCGWGVHNKAEVQDKIKTGTFKTEDLNQ